jgi:hypothetical protein
MSRAYTLVCCCFLLLSTSYAGIGSQVGPQVDTALICSTTTQLDCALAAQAARLVGAPVLATDGTLGSHSLSVLEQMKPRLVVLVGGPAVLPPALEEDLAAHARIIRLWGATATGTSVEVSRFFWGEADTVAIVRQDDLVSIIRARSLSDTPLLLVPGQLTAAVASEVRRLGPSTAFAPGIDLSLGLCGSAITALSPTLDGTRAILYCDPVAAASLSLPVRPIDDIMYLHCDDAPQLASMAGRLSEVVVVGSMDGTETAYTTVMGGIEDATVGGRGVGPLVRREVVGDPAGASAGHALEDLPAWSATSKRIPVDETWHLGWLRDRLAEPTAFDLLAHEGKFPEAWEEGWRERGRLRWERWAEISPSGRRLWIEEERSAASEPLNSTRMLFLLDGVQSDLSQGVELVQGGALSEGLRRLETALERVQRARQMIE